MQRSTFGNTSRPCSSMDDCWDERPHVYRGFTPLIEAAHGRAVSSVGTFTTSERPPLVSGSTCPVGFYCDESTLARVRHSRGVKRTEPRFRNLADDASPGPIYKPYESAAAARPGMKFSKASRFPTSQQREPARLRGTMEPYDQPLAPPRCPSEAAKERCTFGVRHDHTDPRPLSTKPATPYLGPGDLLADLPPYAGRMGSAMGGTKKVDPSPGPGHFLKGQYSAGGPQWTFGRRRPSKAPATPGPGAYRLDKYKPFNKPRGENFARVGHDILRNLPGLDSPGPALYSVMGK